jgi:hypothetical protein
LDPLDPQAYDGASFEIVDGNLWHFAFAPYRTLPAVLFTSREAFIVGQKYYHTARQIGHEIINNNIITCLTTDTAEVVAEDYNYFMPAIKKKERAIPCSTNDLVHVTINPKVAIQDNHPLSHHAISDLHPLIFHGIKYLVMDAMDFYNRMYVMNSNSLLFSGLEVLFLVMRRYDDIGDGGWEMSNEAFVDMLDFLRPWERTDLEAGTAKWNVEKVELVSSIKEAMEKVQRKDF